MLLHHRNNADNWHIKSHLTAHVQDHKLATIPYIAINDNTMHRSTRPKLTIMHTQIWRPPPFLDWTLNMLSLCTDQRNLYRILTTEVISNAARSEYSSILQRLVSAYIQLFLHCHLRRWWWCWQFGPRLRCTSFKHLDTIDTVWYQFTVLFRRHCLHPIFHHPILAQHGNKLTECIHFFNALTGVMLTQIGIIQLE